MRGKPGDGEAKASPSARGRRRRPSELEPAERMRAAMDVALRLLGIRERSRRELARKLAEKGFDGGCIASTLDRLQASGLQDDARFARVFAEEASGRRALASRAIAQQLVSRGVSREVASQAGEDVPGDDESRARSVAVKRLASMREVPPEVRMRRIVAFLQRRGYSSGLCERLARELVNVQD